MLDISVFLCRIISCRFIVLGVQIYTDSVCAVSRDGWGKDVVSEGIDDYEAFMAAVCNPVVFGDLDIEVETTGHDNILVADVKIEDDVVSPGASTPPTPMCSNLNKPLLQPEEGSASSLRHRYRDEYNLRSCKSTKLSAEANSFPNVNYLDKRQYKCKKCQGEGHNARSCKNLMMSRSRDVGVRTTKRWYGCKRCGDGGHNRRTCKIPLVFEGADVSCKVESAEGIENIATGLGSSKRLYICGRCKEVGHNTRTCKSEQKSQTTYAGGKSSKNRYTCSRCGDDGHNKRTCNILMFTEEVVQGNVANLEILEDRYVRASCRDGGCSVRFRKSHLAFGERNANIDISFSESCQSDETQSYTGASSDNNSSVC